MHRLVSSATASLIALSVSAHSPRQTQSSAPAESPIEIQISGPKVIHVGQDLHFKVTLVNRSAAPVVLTYVHDGWADSNFQWSITDTADRLLSPPTPTGPQQLVCLMSGPVPEERIQIIEPGEKFLYTTNEDPPDDFAFPGKGFYKVKLRFSFDPATLAPLEALERDYKLLPYAPKPGPKRVMLYRTPKIDVSSNIWTMYLTK